MVFIHVTAVLPGCWKPVSPRLSAPVLLTGHHFISIAALFSSVRSRRVVYRSFYLCTLWKGQDCTIHSIYPLFIAFTLDAEVRHGTPYHTDVSMNLMYAKPGNRRGKRVYVYLGRSTFEIRSLFGLRSPFRLKRPFKMRSQFGLTAKFTSLPYISMKQPECCD